MKMDEEIKYSSENYLKLIKHHNPVTAEEQNPLYDECRRIVGYLVDSDGQEHKWKVFWEVSQRLVSCTEL